MNRRHLITAAAGLTVTAPLGDSVTTTHTDDFTAAQIEALTSAEIAIILADGSFFGTLCALDPRPARVNTPETIGMFRLFAELIAKHLDASRKLAATESALLEERAESELREQFIAVLGHDLRTPARSIRWPSWWPFALPWPVSCWPR